MLVRSKLIIALLLLIILNACAQKATYEISGCHVFDKGTVSIFDTMETALWVENHNDVHDYFCGGVK